MPVEMKSYVLLFALMQSLGCSGAPLYNSELQAMANRGLSAAMAEVNSVYATSYLYGVIQGKVKRVIPMGLNTDLLIKFGIKETVCQKTSTEDPRTCALRRGFSVPYYSCSSRVRMSDTSAQVVTLNCKRDSESSSSSESSEEIFSRRRQQFNLQFANRAAPARPAPPARPTPPPTPPPVQRGFSHSETMEVQPRGDVFSNFLV